MVLAELNRVSKSYLVGFSRRKRVSAVTDVTFTINQGAVVGIVGPNGSGKSTSIKTMLGLISPDSGFAKLFGLSPTDPKAFRHLGYIAENVAFSDTLTAPEILAYHAAMHKLGRDAKPRGDALLERVGLGAHRKKTTRQFSKGMVQRLALACALIHDPELLVLDEPMSGLDPIGRRFMIDILAEQHARGKTVFFSSHVLHDIDELCDQLVVINQGKLVFTGPKQEFTHEFGAYRLLFSFAGDLPGWLLKALPMGVKTWALTGAAQELFDVAVRIHGEGGQVLEYGRHGASLETSFFNLVNLKSSG